MSEATLSIAAPQAADLYTQHHPFIVNVCKRILKDEDEARDAAQEVFCKVILHLDSFLGACEIKTWMYRIAVNECYSRITAWKRKRIRLDEYATHRTLAGESAPDNGLLSLVAARRYREGLETAGKTTRKVLHMYVQQGLTHNEIARALGVSRVAVTRRITRFRQGLGERDRASLRMTRRAETAETRMAA